MLTFRIMEPSSSSVYEVSGIRSDAAPGDQFTVKFVSKMGYDKVLNLDYPVTVLANEDGLIRLKHSDETWFIIKK